MVKTDSKIEVDFGGIMRFEINTTTRNLVPRCGALPWALPARPQRRAALLGTKIEFHQAQSALREQLQNKRRTKKMIAQVNLGHPANRRKESTGS